MPTSSHPQERNSRTKRSQGQSDRKRYRDEEPGAAPYDNRSERPPASTNPFHSHQARSEATEGSKRGFHLDAGDQYGDRSHRYHRSSAMRFASIATETDELIDAGKTEPPCILSFHAAMNVFGLCISLFFLSALVLASGIQLCVKEHECRAANLWAVVCSAVSVAVSAYFAYIYKYHRSFSLSMSRYISPFLFAWWALGMLLTFLGPFAYVCTGYFATCMAFVCCLGLLVVSGDKTELRLMLGQMAYDPGKSMALVGILVSSIMVFLGSVFHAGGIPYDDQIPSDIRIWAGVIGAISVAVCCFTLYCKVGPQYPGLFLLLLWTVGVILITPYSRGSANCLFGTWVAFFSALVCAVSEINQYGIDLSCFCCYDPDQEFEGDGSDSEVPDDATTARGGMDSASMVSRTTAGNSRATRADYLRGYGGVKDGRYQEGVR